MTKIIDKRNYIILGIIIILLVFIIMQMILKKEEYSHSYNYFDHYIVLKIYENKDIFDNVDKIYQKYDKIMENDKLLEKIIAYGKKVYKQTNGYVDISKKSLVEGNKNFKTKIKKLSIKDKDDIILDSIISSYATAEVIKYLKKEGITKYLISDDGDISAGDYYQKGKYRVSISYNNKLLNIVSLENESMVTRSTVDENKSYMYNPIEKEITKKYDSVVVIAKDVKDASFLAEALYLMDRKEAIKLIKKYKASALWYQNGKIYMENFDKYIGD